MLMKIQEVGNTGKDSLNVLKTIWGPFIHTASTSIDLPPTTQKAQHPLGLASVKLISFKIPSRVIYELHFVWFDKKVTLGCLILLKLCPTLIKTNN